MRKKLQQLEKRSREAESSSLKQQQAHQGYQHNPDLLAAYKEGELTIVQELVKPSGVSGSSITENNQRAACSVSGTESRIGAAAQQTQS
jgi:uncharacterized Fe-S cluster-containing radical SAM superfamily enzyme